MKNAAIVPCRKQQQQHVNIIRYNIQSVPICTNNNTYGTILVPVNVCNLERSETHSTTNRTTGTTSCPCKCKQFNKAIILTMDAVIILLYSSTDIH